LRVEEWRAILPAHSRRGPSDRLPTVVRATQRGTSLEGRGLRSELSPPLFVIRLIEGGGRRATSQRERSGQREAGPASEAHFTGGWALDDARTAGARSRSGATGRGRQGVRQAGPVASSDRVLKVTSRGDRGAPALLTESQASRSSVTSVVRDRATRSLRASRHVGGNLRRGGDSATRACGATHHHHRARQRLSRRLFRSSRLPGCAGLPRRGSRAPWPHRGNHGHPAPFPGFSSVTCLPQHRPGLLADPAGA